MVFVKTYTSLVSSITQLVQVFRSTLKFMKNKNRNTQVLIDFENGVIDGVLKQIRQSGASGLDPKIAKLIPVWCCNIKVTETKLLLVFIKEMLTPFDEVSLTHVKRFKKESDEQQGTFLRAILCSGDLYGTEGDLRELFREHCAGVDSQHLPIYKTDIPKHGAPTAEISKDWSEKYWPMSWKGNPNHQVLLNADFDVAKERTMVNATLDELEKRAGQHPGDVPVVTIIATPQHEILTTAYDHRDTHVLKHSVMNAIQQIADLEVQRRSNRNAVAGEEDSKANNNYLCHNLHVYTTHEPCVMCSMALVHSRIGRLVYIKSMPSTGALESNYQLGDRDGLNWNFETWKWIADEENKRLDAIMEKSKHELASNTHI